MNEIKLLLYKPINVKIEKEKELNIPILDIKLENDIPKFEINQGYDENLSRNYFQDKNYEKYRYMSYFFLYPYLYVSYDYYQYISTLYKYYHNLSQYDFIDVIKDDKICNLSYLPVSSENLDISSNETHNKLYDNIKRFKNNIKDHIVLSEYLTFLNCIKLNESEFTNELNLIFRNIYHLPTLQLLYLYSLFYDDLSIERSEFELGINGNRVIKFKNFNKNNFLKLNHY